MRTITLLMPILLLTACARTEWAKAGASPAQVATDRAECEYEGVKAAASSNGNELRRASAKGEVRSACLTLRGYHRRRI